MSEVDALWMEGLTEISDLLLQHIYLRNLINHLDLVLPLGGLVVLSIFPGTALSLWTGTGMHQKSGGSPKKYVCCL